MKLILLDGGPASGKNTLGMLLVQRFHKQGNKVILLDLDVYVEELNPSWIWKSKQKEEKDQQKARENFIHDINKYLLKDFIVIVIGERFLAKENISNFISRLKETSSVFLYHLSIPFSLRTQRLAKRGPHSLIDLKKDQKDRDLNIKWYGYVYKNINSKKIDANNLFKLIQKNKGLLDMNLF
jgi:thymidylate kinase